MPMALAEPVPASPAISTITRYRGRPSYAWTTTAWRRGRRCRRRRRGGGRGGDQRGRPCSTRCWRARRWSSTGRGWRRLARRYCRRRAVGSTSLAVAPLLSQINAAAVAYDNGVNVATAQRLLKACQYGTPRVQLLPSAALRRQPAGELVEREPLGDDGRGEVAGDADGAAVPAGGRRGVQGGDGGAEGGQGGRPADRVDRDADERVAVHLERVDRPGLHVRQGAGGAVAVRGHADRLRTVR